MKSSTENLDNYEIYKYVNDLNDFVIGDFSRIYLKIAKKRILYGNRKDAKQAVDIVNYIFYNLLILLSPVAPFTAESAYQSNYGSARSVSLLDWPKYKEKLIGKEIEEEFGIAVETITALLNAREKAGVKLRWPIASALVEVKEDRTQTILEKLSQIIEEYTNIKEVRIKKVESFGREVRPLFAKIGPDFKEKAGAVAEALRKEEAGKLESAVSSEGHYSLRTAKGMVDVTADHFTIVQKVESENAVMFKHGIASVDKQVSKELFEEGMVREFERRVQMARKEKELKKTDRIRLFYQASEQLAEMVKRNAGKIKKDVNAKELHDKLKEGSGAQEFDIEEETLRIDIEKLV
jgi:isoleucyl-tRNA synthetase